MLLYFMFDYVAYIHRARNYRSFTLFARPKRSNIVPDIVQYGFDCKNSIVAYADNFAVGMIPSSGVLWNIGYPSETHLKLKSREIRSPITDVLITQSF